MEFRSKLLPSFFKVLISDDFTTQLVLPPYFVQQNINTLPTDAKLQTVNEQTWYVKIERVDGRNHCFTKGWSEFVKSAKLKHCEFLVFWFDCDNSTFHVSGYGVHGCEYDISGCKTRVISDDDESSEDQPIGRGENESARTSASDSSSPQFVVGLKEYQRRRVVLNKELSKHLIGKEFVIMEYTLTQRSKKVVLHDRTQQGRCFTLGLGSGWNDFCKENGLKFGKSYLFVYNGKRDVIQVSPVEKDLQVTAQGKDRTRHFARKLVTSSDRYNVDPESSSARIKRKYVKENGLEDDSDDDLSEDQPVAHGKNKITHLESKSARRSDRYNQVDPKSLSARIKRKYGEEKVSENYDDSDDDSSEVKIAGHYVAETVSENDDEDDDSPSELETNGLVKKKSAMTSVFDYSSPQFEMVLKNYQISRVKLGKEFMERACLFGKKAVYLMYEPTQRRTNVLLDNSCGKGTPCRRELAMGWSDFRKENGLLFGKSYSFVYNRERNVILVTPVKSKSQVKKKHKKSAGNPVFGSYHSNKDPHSWSSRIKRDYTEGSSTEDDEDDDDDGEKSEDQEPEMNGFGKQKLKNEVTIQHEEIVLKEWKVRRMPLHMEFAEKAHLIGKKSVNLLYAPTQNSTQVLLSNSSPGQRFRLELTTNWPEFQKDNGLKVGATYLFTFNPSRNVIEVQPVEEKMR